jgi:hypothetical protein
MKDSKKRKYTCHTCHFPIYEGEEVYKSNTGKSTRDGSSTTYHGGGYRGRRGGVYGGVSRRYSTSETDRKSFSWVQCGWCLAEFRKEQQRYYDWQTNFDKLFSEKQKKYSLIFGFLGLVLGGVLFSLTYFLRNLNSIEEKGDFIVSVVIMWAFCVLIGW